MAEQLNGSLLARRLDGWTMAEQLNNFLMAQWLDSWRTAEQLDGSTAQFLGTTWMADNDNNDDQCCASHSHLFTVFFIIIGCRF
jgi:hypothetical protein